MRALYPTVAAELQQAAACVDNHRNHHHSSAALWAMGPAGNAWYRTVVEGTRRLWQRQFLLLEDASSSTNTNNNASPPTDNHVQTLWTCNNTHAQNHQNNHHISIDPCLSNDERWMGHVTVETGTGVTHVHLSDLTVSPPRLQCTWTLAAPVVQLVIAANANAVTEYNHINKTKNMVDVYMVTANAEGRPHELHRGRQYGHHDEARLHTTTLLWSVAEDQPRAAYLHIYPTKGGQYLVAQAQSLDSNVVYLLDMMRMMEEELEIGRGEKQNMDQQPEWIPVGRPHKGHPTCHHVDVGANQDVILGLTYNNRTNDNGQVTTVWMETTVDQLPLSFHDDDTPPPDNFTVSGYIITEMDLYRYWIVVYEVSAMNGAPRIRVVDRRRRGDVWVIDGLHDNGLSRYQPVHNVWYDSTSCRFQVDTPIRPSEVYEYHFVSRRLKLVSSNDTDNVKASDDSHPQPPTQSPPRPSIQTDYEMERVVVSSQDGTLIPLSLVRRRNVPSSGQVLLTAYGAYGENADLSYNPVWQPLLARGYVVAWAHIRGGGELGASWHAQGRRQHKVRGIQDYLACARALRQYLLDPVPTRLIAKAFSAGGVAVASAVNCEPHLFNDVVLTNAFLDVYNTMKNPHLALTKLEWDEYGNPLQDVEMDDLIKSYCPVQTALPVTQVPRMLLIAAKEDEAVPYQNTLAYAKNMRQNTHPDNADGVFVWLEDGVGHDLGYKLLHISSVELAFILSGESEKDELR